jgi:GNAT superfamily N-acetyltransferase
MTDFSIETFGDEHLDGAAVLLAERHRSQRRVEPLLSARFEEPAAARIGLAAAWAAEGASGAVAVSNGDMVGYLIGAPKASSGWGPNAWVDTAGHAVLEPETLRDLYAVAAERWFAEGGVRHYALVPATDAALVDTWFRLGFGQQQALGIREVPPPSSTPSDVSVRRGEPADVEAVVALDRLAEHQANAPVFSAGPEPPDPEAVRAEVAEELADEAAATLLAELDGRPVGIATVAPVSYSGLHTGVAQPDDACILGYAYTLPEVRGSGAGRALTDAVFAWARERSYTTVVVDWRVTNLLASRFWPARGFRTTFLRLYRSIP